MGLNIPLFKPYHPLMLLSQRQQMPLVDYLRFIQLCAQSGVSCVQLREKNATPEFLLEFGQKLKTILDPLNVPLIINDNVALALQLDAAGVHLGQSDGDPLEARKLLGPHKIIGVSIESEEQLITANTLPINYVAASAVFESKNKSNLQKIWGLEGVQYLSKMTHHTLIGIGGIDIHNVKSVITAGAHGVAVIGALHEAHNPQAMAQRLRQEIGF